uniref:Peptidase metallopeptidase domain-containing protein n=1 Tax=Pygocentrus nattereri TaxID=42514 RepID=A0AAR2JWA4_PYGNA
KMKAFYQLCILIGLVIKTHSGPVPANIGKEEDDLAKNYLKKLYNMKEEHTRSARSTDHSVSEMSEKLSEMQEFFGLKVTGTLDAETLEVMKKPRCGVPDVAGYNDATGSYKWTKKQLTYRYLNYTSDMTQEEVDSSIGRALKVWADITPLRFSRIYSGVADIMISFPLTHEMSVFYKYNKCTSSGSQK